MGRYLKLASGTVPDSWEVVFVRLQQSYCWELEAVLLLQAGGLLLPARAEEEEASRGQLPTLRRTVP